MYCFMPRDRALDDPGFYLDRVRRIEYGVLMNDENNDLELLRYYLPCVSLKRVSGCSAEPMRRPLADFSRFSIHLGFTLYSCLCHLNPRYSLNPSIPANLSFIQLPEARASDESHVGTSMYSTDCGTLQTTYTPAPSPIMLYEQD